MRLIALIIFGTFLVALLVVLLPAKRPPRQEPLELREAKPRMILAHSGGDRWTATASRDFVATPPRPAEEIVAEKLNQFARNREEIVDAIARKFDIAVPDEVRRFFASVHAGNWTETTNLFEALKQLRQSTNSPPGFLKLWPAIMETYGVAEQTHLWPAQQLLDYGNAVLDSLRPGMVYVGGNDAGRFIPTLLSETSGGEPFIVLTQNALADGSYLDYVQFLYGDRLNVLSAADSQKAFEDYLADAKTRLKHDQDFPNEPKQVRPGEDIRITDGRVQVSGQVAVMSINELLLRSLLEKNPEFSFALTESFPLKSFYGEANTLGAVTELRASGGGEALTADRAAQSIDYWRSAIEAVLVGTDGGSAPRDDYAKLILGQAGLFEDRQLNSAAEQAYQLAISLSPANPETVFRYVNLLTQQHRYGEAQRIVQNALLIAPNNQQFRDVLASLGRMK